MDLKRIIIHVDMDAFYASVEMRDHPELRGKPLIIGALPHQRGVVATCSYEARKYGIHSAMNIKDAYKRCPNGIYRRPNMEKYRRVSEQIRSIWRDFTPVIETVAFDEAYLDVTEQARTFEEARNIAIRIKQRIKEELDLTCSVGLGYSKAAAKTASEEKKPNGLFVIKTPHDFIDLIIDRDVRVLHTVGPRTAQKLYDSGIRTVRDVRNNKKLVQNLFGKQGELITDLAFGIDRREVKPHRPEDAKSISREVTFQKDTVNYTLLEDILLLLALCVEEKAKRYGLYGTGITLKITYEDMKSITRSRSVFNCDSALTIWKEAVELLERIEKRPVRLIGVGLHGLSSQKGRQISIIDLLPENKKDRKEIDRLLNSLKDRYGLDFANNLNKIFNSGVLHKTVEFMRKHFPRETVIS